MLTEKRKTDINKRVQDLRAEVFVQDGKVMARIAFTNCSYGTISAMKLKLRGYNSFSEAVLVDGSHEFIIMVQDLDIPPMQMMEAMVTELPGPDIRIIDVLPYQICYSDGMIVSVENPDIIEYQVEKLQSGCHQEEDLSEDDISEDEQLACIRKMRKNAIGYPKKHPLGWICICGDLNRDENLKCAVCKSEKEFLFSACTKEQVMKKCKEERAAKQAEAEKNKAESRHQEAVQEIRQQQSNRRIMIAAIVCILAVILGGAYYVKTYGMNKETRVQWQEALQSYDDWKKGTAAAMRDYENAMKAFSGKTYTYAEIVSISELDESRYAALDKINEINQIADEFPQKYQPVFKKLAECQETFYAIMVDQYTISAMCDAQTAYADYSDKPLKVFEEVKRLEGYLNDKYLNTDKVDLNTAVSLTYTPKVYTYIFESGKSFTSSILNLSQLEEAKEAADLYCRLLAKNQPSISKITYTGKSSGSTLFAYFEYKVTYVNGTTRIGEVTVRKNASSTWEALGMDFD